MGTKWFLSLILFCLLIHPFPLVNASEPVPGEYVLAISEAELERRLEEPNAAGILTIFSFFELPYARVQEIKDGTIVFRSTRMERSAVLMPQDVIDKLSIKIRSEPENASNWFKRGVVHACYGGLNSLRGNVATFEGELDAAIADFSQAINLEPENVKFYLSRGKAFHSRAMPVGRTNQKPNFDKAIKDFDEALRVDPNCSLAYSCRGFCSLLLLEFDQAVVDASKAISLDANATDAYLLRGIASKACGNFKDALSDFQKVLQSNPNDVDVLVDCSLILATCLDDQLRDGKMAIQYAQKACEITHLKVWRPVFALAASQAEAGDFVSAVATVQEAEKLEPDSYENSLTRFALTLFSSGRPYRERLILKKSLKESSSTIPGATLDEPCAGDAAPKADSREANASPDSLAIKLKAGDRVFPKLTCDESNDDSNAGRRQRLSKYDVAEINGQQVRIGSKWLPRRAVLATEEAWHYFNEQVKRNPMCLDATVMLGLVQVEKELFADAVDTFSQAIRLDANLGLAYEYRACLRRALDDLDNSLRDYDEAIRLDPNVSSCYCGRGEVLYSKRDLENAHKDLSKSLELDPSDVTARFCRANVAYEQKQFQSAVDDYTKVIELSPDTFEAYVNISNALTQLGQFEAAARYSTQWINRRPLDPNAYETRGWQLLMVCNFKKAADDYSRALALDQKNSLARVGLGICLYKFGKHKLAVQSYEQALDINPSDSWALINLARLRATCDDVDQRDGEQAVELAKKACRIAVKRNYYYSDTLAACYAEVGDFVKAIETQEHAIVLRRLYPLSTMFNTDESELQERLEFYKSKKSIDEFTNPVDP